MVKKSKLGCLKCVERADYNLNLGFVLFDFIIWYVAVNVRVRKKMSRILTKIFKV